MSWDHPVHSFSYPNGEPQTPTRTPTTTAFDAAFHTPKLESSFFDPRVTWDTSDPYASSPEFLRTPQRFGLSTPSNPVRIPDTIPERNGATESATVRSAKASDTDTAKRIRSSKPNAGFGEDGPRTVDSAKSAASMQTPPPTSASRRKVSEVDNANGTARRLSTQSMAGGHLETPSRLLGTSPRLFANLQSSPDLFQLGSVDPSTSPFFPQQKLFWDQDLEPPGNEHALPGTSMNETTAFNPSHAAMSDLHIPQLPSIDGSMDLPEFSDGGFGLVSAPPTDAAFFPAPFSTSPRLPVTKAEDPAMFLSSPARRFGGPQPTPQKGLFSRTARQPYHHQTEESKREELRRARSQRRQLTGSLLERDEEEADDFTPRQPRPGLTRSLTHSAVTAPSRRLSLGQSSFAGTMATTSGIRKSPSKGRSSPIKSIRHPLPRANSVATGFPTRSQSLVLKIGKDGRAKTEMQVVEESRTGLTDPTMGMELDDSSTESDSDSAEYSGYPIIHSNNPSFAFSDAGRPMLARSESSSRPHSKGSYTSIASSRSGRMSPWAGLSRGGSRRSQLRPSPEDRRRTPKRQSMPINPDFTHRSIGAVSEATVDEDNGDAQHALRKVLKGRGRNPMHHTIGYGPGPFTHLRSSPPRFGSEPDLHSGDSNGSPTTLTDPDLATPSTARHCNPSNGTRCVCNSMDNGGHLMIQCESCNHWLHTKCVGLERANLPSVYVCVFCAQTPSRKNRTRDTLGSTLHAPTSPLAHKSFRFR